MTRIDKAAALAAGKGTRMAPWTRARPKALIRLGGRTLLDRALDCLEAAGARRTAVNAHHWGGMTSAAARKRGAETSRERTLLDTGGGARRAAGLLGSGAWAIWAVNADAVFTDKDVFTRLAHALTRTRREAVLALAHPSKSIGVTKQAGDFAMEADGSVRRGGRWIYAGAQAIRLSLLEETAGARGEAFSMNAAWDIAAARGGLGGAALRGWWLHVGDVGAVRRAEGFLRRRGATR